jgi:hypothetical protein
MVCYSIVLGAAIAVHSRRNRMSDMLPQIGVLSLLLWGGATALIIDHFLNGELFMIGGDILWDLFVGVAMTAIIFVIWSIYVMVKKSYGNEHQFGVQ